MATIAVLGTLDSKGEEHAFVAGLIAARLRFRSVPRFRFGNFAANPEDEQRGNDADEEDVAMEMRVAEAREKVILSLDTAGRVREYQLRYRVGFRVHDGKGQSWIPTSEIALTRDISFNDSQIIAKENEEALLYRDMQTDMVQQMVRRLARARLTGG